MLTVILALLVGAVAGGGGAVMVRAIRAERARQRDQVKTWNARWDREYAALADGTAMPADGAVPGGPRLGEAATFRVPAQPARPVVVDAVVVDPTRERAR